MKDQKGKIVIIISLIEKKTERERQRTFQKETKLLPEL